MPLFHPSGGLVYHARAWRWGNRLWAPFHDQVRRWLTDWRPPASHLLLLGPSGGYALSRPFLERFDRLTVVEPDPLARRLLVRRFPGRAFAFAGDPGLARADGFARLARAWPDAAFLFCNLLGQDLTGAPDGFDRPAWLRRLPADLAGRHWASWHDLAATDQAPTRHDPVDLPRGEDLEASLARFWQGRGPDHPLAIHDSGCAGLLPDAPRRLAVWQLAPGRHHLIEWLAAG